MAEFQLSVYTGDSIQETGSVIEVYVNDQLLAELTQDRREFQDSVCVPEGMAHIGLVRRYYDENAGMQEECGPVARFFAKAFGAGIAVLLAAGDAGAPFECPYEAKETFVAEDIGDGAAIICSCTLDPAKMFPSFVVQSKNCSIHTEKKAYMVSEKEIEARYRERKQVIELVAIAAGLLSLVLLVLGLASGIYTTVLFAVILLGIFICCGAVALASLHKAYRTKLEQMKRTVGGV